MKAVPRMAERKVAEILSEFYMSLGCRPVKRIPVLGKTGPDIELNEFNFAVDVKSRISIPASLLAKSGELIVAPGMIGFRISDVGKLEALRRQDVRSSVTVKRWLDHQHEWTTKNTQDGISAIALRRPGMRMDATTIIILETQEQLWNQRIQQFRHKILAS